MHKKPEKFEPPRSLKGRRARRIYRELASKLAASDKLDAANSVLLALYATSIADIAANLYDATSFDLREALSLGRSLGLTK